MSLHPRPPAHARWAVLAALAALLGPGRAAAQVTVTDVVGRMPLGEFNSFILTSSYKDWGNEPFIAVNPANTSQIAVSGFAYSYGSTGAPLWYSTDGGQTFGMRFSVTPAPQGSGPHDQVYQYDTAGTLHGVNLTNSGSTGFIYHGSTIDPSADGRGGRPPSVWTWTGGNLASSTGTSPDQPWIAVRGAGPAARVFAAYDNFNSSFGAVEERVAVSNDGGLTFSAPVAVSRGGQVGTFTNPGLRITADATGDKVYAIFGIGDSGLGGGVEHVNYRLNQSIDGGATWRYTNNSTNPGGLAIDSGNSSQIGGSFGGKNELRGNTTAVAVDAAGSHVYTVYGKRNASGVDQLFVAEFHPTNPNDLNSNLVAGSVTRISPAADPAALPSATVLSNGTLVVMYDSFTGGRYHIHVTKSTDSGASFTDQDVYNFDPSFITLNTPAFNDRSRALGDYQFLTSIGDQYFGVFAGQGNTNAGGIDTTGMIVPMMITETPVPEPAVPLLAAAGLVALMRRRSRVA